MSKLNFKDTSKSTDAMTFVQNTDRFVEFLQSVCIFIGSRKNSIGDFNYSARSIINYACFNSSWVNLFDAKIGYNGHFEFNMYRDYNNHVVLEPKSHHYSVISKGRSQEEFIKLFANKLKEAQHVYSNYKALVNICKEFADNSYAKCKSFMDNGGTISKMPYISDKIPVTGGTLELDYDGSRMSYSRCQLNIVVNGKNNYSSVNTVNGCCQRYIAKALKHIELVDFDKIWDRTNTEASFLDGFTVGELVDICTIFQGKKRAMALLPAEVKKKYQNDEGFSPFVVEIHKTAEQEREAVLRFAVSKIDRFQEEIRAEYEAFVNKLNAKLADQYNEVRKEMDGKLKEIADMIAEYDLTIPDITPPRSLQGPAKISCYSHMTY